MAGLQEKSNRNLAYLIDQELCCPPKEDNGDVNVNLLSMSCVQYHYELKKKKRGQLIISVLNNLSFTIRQKLKF